MSNTRLDIEKLKASENEAVVDVKNTKWTVLNESDTNNENAKEEKKEFKESDLARDIIRGGIKLGNEIFTQTAEYQTFKQKHPEAKQNELFLIDLKKAVKDVVKRIYSPESNLPENFDKQLDDLFEAYTQSAEGIAFNFISSPISIGSGFKSFHLEKNLTNSIGYENGSFFFEDKASNFKYEYEDTKKKIQFNIPGEIASRFDPVNVNGVKGVKLNHIIVTTPILEELAMKKSVNVEKWNNDVEEVNRLSNVTVKYKRTLEDQILKSLEKENPTLHLYGMEVKKDGSFGLELLAEAYDSKSLDPNLAKEKSKLGKSTLTLFENYKIITKALAALDNQNDLPSIKIEKFKNELKQRFDATSETNKFLQNILPETYKAQSFSLFSFVTSKTKPSPSPPKKEFK